MVKLNKEDYSFCSKFKAFEVYRKEVDKWNGKVIKKTNKNKNDEYAYYLCRIKGIDANDAYIFSDGILLGMSKDDIEKEDVTIIL